MAKYSPTSGIFQPAAHRGAHGVDGSGGVFVGFEVDQFKILAEPQQIAKPFQSQVGSGEQLRFPAGVSRFDEQFKCIEKRGLNAIPEKKFLIAGKFFQLWNQIENKIVQFCDRINFFLHFIS